MKFAFDFGRLPLHWPIAKFLLRLFGYRELLNHSQRDIMAAFRTWMTEDTQQVPFSYHLFQSFYFLPSTMLTSTIFGYLVYEQWLLFPMKIHISIRNY